MFCRNTFCTRTSNNSVLKIKRFSTSVALNYLLVRCLHIACYLSRSKHLLSSNPGWLVLHVSRSVTFAFPWPFIANINLLNILNRKMLQKLLPVVASNCQYTVCFTVTDCFTIRDTEVHEGNCNFRCPLVPASETVRFDLFTVLKCHFLPNRSLSNALNVSKSAFIAFLPQ